MFPELGHFALIVALCVAVVQTIFPLIGATRGIRNWMAVARPAAYAQGLFILLAFVCLSYSFIINDFSVTYVAGHSNTLLPTIYRFSAVWGGHEGSLLLWVLMLSFWGVSVALFSKNLPETTAARVLAVLGFVSVGFLLFMLLTSNPFDRIFPMPLEGRDLNPLLQDPGLVFHPPMLYMGYVGFSVAFAFAIAALLEGRLDSAWARWSRPWTIIAWVFLTAGISLGSWWAYYELGWGGWWFWDPVENASFMPWLVGTALVHSLIVTEKRAAFKNWTVLLAIIAFSLSLLGTFLVRSGVLTSVHAFATDPERGIFILIFLCVVIGISFVLYAWRAPKVGTGGHFELGSRETFLLIGNVLLVVASASVLLGTLYPLFMDALGMGKISVGPPYFDAIFFLIMTPLVLVMGLAPLSRWKKQPFIALLKQLKWIIVASILFGFTPMLVVGFKAGLGVWAGIAGAAWITLTMLKNLSLQMRNQRSLLTLPRGVQAMSVAHLGVSVFIIGVTLSNAFSIETDVRMAVGEPTEIGGYTFNFIGVTNHKADKEAGINYNAYEGEISVSQAGQLVATLHPQKRIYLVQTMPMTEAAIHANVIRDVYVALGEELETDAWGVRVYIKYFVRWIWFGSILMIIGGFLAISDKRYRRVKKTVEA